MEKHIALRFTYGLQFTKRNRQIGFLHETVVRIFNTHVRKIICRIAHRRPLLRLEKIELRGPRAMRKTDHRPTLIS